MISGLRKPPQYRNKNSNALTGSHGYTSFLITGGQGIAGNYSLALELWTIRTLYKYKGNIELKHVNRLRKCSSM